MKKSLTLILLALFCICGYAQNVAITLTSNPSGAGTLTGGGNYTQGQSCTITATAKTNYAFENWTKDGSVVSYLPSYTFTVTESAEYVANFKHINGIVVGGATDQSYYLPTYYYYKYSLTQQIYTASELGGQSGQIASVSFYNTTGYTNTRKLALYLVATDKTAFESRYDWITVNNTTNLMFNGTVTFEPNSWTTIYFNNPFFYNGASNIALIVDDNQGTQDYGSAIRFRSYNASGNQAIYANSNTTNYNPTNPSNYYGTLLTQKNQVILGFAQYNITVSATANPSTGGTVGGNTGLHYYGQPVTLTATANTGYVFNNWTKNGEVVSYLSTYTFPATETAQYVANFQQVEGIAIGNADTTNIYLPTYSRNPYSMTQQIYTAAEMGSTSHEISSVSFFNTGPTKTRRFDIYMVETSKTAFESQTDWIPVSESDKVFSGNVSFASNGWTTINFNKVFNYNASTNVALVIDDNYYWDYGSYLSCRAFNTSGNQAMYVYSVYGSDIDPTNPSNFTGTLLAKKNQVIFGFPNYIYTVTATASPEGWGTVSGNEDLFYMGQSCTLTATASEGHYFKNWTKNGTSVSTNATYTFTVTGDTELVANFVEPIMISATANPEEGGSVSGGGEYGPNQTCTLTATPNEGYVFLKWTRNGSTVSSLPTYSFTVSTTNDYVAHFYKVEDAVAIGEPTINNSYLPTYTYSSYSLTQQIYTADELNLNAGPISSISFFSNSSSQTRNMTVYMVNTTKSSFNSANDWITVSGSNLVFSGTVSVAYYNWTTIYFVAPFYYDGSSNIALIVDDNTSDDYYHYSTSFRVYATESTQAIRINGEENYDPCQPSAYDGTLVSMKNQIILGFPRYEYTASAIANPEEGGSVTGGGGLYYYGQPIPFNATANESYVFNYWTKPHESYGYDVVASCLSSVYLPVNGNIQYTAYFQEMDGLVVGEAKHTNRHLPISEYPYFLTQQIYTADELNIGACDISSLSFFNTGYSYYEGRNLVFYLVGTDKTAFNDTNDWIAVTDEDIVYSGEIYWNESDWTTLYFDTPFSYDGSSNLALVVRNESGQWDGGMSFRTFDTQDTQAIYVFDEDYAINPSSAVGTLISEKNQVVFGVASYDYTVSVSANPEEGGTVSGGGGLYYYGQYVPVTATPNPGYVFNNWSKHYEEPEYDYEYDEVVSYLSSDNVFVTESSEYVAYFDQMDGIIIGEAAKISQNLPIHYYYYSMSQQIFTADEMNADVCEISSVSFFNTEYSVTRNLDVYMVNTTKSAFADSSDWIAVTEGDLMFSGEITLEGYGWSTIYFVAPFNYDGSSNVALVINDKTGSWGSELFCRTFDTQDPQAMYIFGENSFNPNSPSNYTGELLTEKNQVVFGLASYDYEVTVSANPPAGGTAIGGGELYYYGQPIPLAATTNDGYAFSNWTKGNEVVSCFPEFTLSVTETAEYVANFMEVDGILIGEPLHANSNLPSYYYNSLTEQIYTASEMGRQGQPCVISSVSFFNAGSSRTRNINLYMVHTDKTAFESNNDWIAVTESDTVLYSGSFNFQAKRWTTIYFTKPFYYDGSSNVALILDDNSNSYYYYSDPFRCRTFDTDDTQVLRISGYQNTDYDPYNPTSYSGSRMSVKNQVIFGYAHYDYMVTASANPPEGGDVEGNTGLHYYGRPITLTATTNSSYVFNKWTKNDETVSYLSTYSFPVTETAEYVANFQQVNGIVIGDAVSTNYNLPTNTYYYCLSQQIYTAAEMGNMAQAISSVSFFNTGSARTRNLAIYMVHTDKTTFESTTDWITVTEADKVFNGSVNFAATDWTTINFNEVFDYDGSSNIALIVDDNTRNYGSNLYCRTFNTEGNQAISASNYNMNFDPCNPITYSGTLVSEKNQVVFGYPSYNYSVTVSANPVEGGTASGGGEGYHLGQLSTVEATANPGYCFYNWTLDGTVVSLENPYTFPVTGDMELVANFGTPIVVNVTANPSNGGTVTGGGGYGPNHSCTLTAVPNPGYVFTKWTKGNSTSYISYLSTYTFTVSNYTAGDYIANFEPVNNGVAIGDAVSSNSYLPYNYSPYSLSQQIYTADELNIGQCQISNISLFATSAGSTHKITVYMVNTSKTSFESANDWIGVTEADIVYSGYFTPTSGAWSTLYFNTPFSYNGSSNIALIVDDNTGDSNNGPYYRTFNTQSSQSIRINNYEENYDPYNPTIYSGTLSTEKNQIIFGFPTYGYSATVSANPQEGGTVSGGGGSNYFYGQNILVNATPNPGYVFNNWTKNGNVVSYFVSDNVSVTENAEFVANFQQMEGIVVGQPVSTNQNLPTYGYYYDMSQQIYTAAEMGGIGAEISSVSFFNTQSTRYRTMDVYMVSTDKSSFANNYDWITVTEADRVFSGSVTITGYNWTTIYFSTPFEYDGSSNVALIIVDNTGNYDVGLRCRSYETDDIQAIYTYDSSEGLDPLYPTGYYGSLVRQKNQVVFGTANYDYTVTITLDPEEGGTVVSGEGQCYYGQPLPISVTANPGYVFNKWTKQTEQNGYYYNEDISYLSTDVVSVTESSEYVAHFQQMDGIIIGEALHASQYLPNCYYYNSMSQQIYTAEELNVDECEISSVSFFNAYYNGTRNFDIYMVNTSKNEFTGPNDWVAVTEENLVHSGNISFSGHGWTTIYFTTPFSYDGSSNAILVINDKTGQWSSNLHCRTFDTQGTQAIYASGSTAFDPYSPSGYSGNLLAEKNQVVFGIASYDYSVSVSANPSAGGSVVGGGGPYYYGQPIQLSSTANNGYVFSSWTKGDEVVSCFPDFTLNVTETAEYVANFKSVDGILIGEPAHASSYLPTYYHNSLTEQIYTAAEMGGASCEISSVSFFNTGTYSKTRNLDIYMVHTEKTAFEDNTDWIAVTPSEEALFSGSVTFPAKSWVTIYFANPFNYNGSTNVALIVDDNSNISNYADIKCRTFDTENTQAIRVYNSSSTGTNYNPYNPSSYTGSLLSEKNQVIFGYAHYDYEIYARANPASGGFVNGVPYYYDSHYYGQPVSLVATTKPQYVFNSWTKDEETISYYSTYNFSVSENAEYVANFQQTNGIVIGDAITTNSSLPTNPYYYSLSQQIYTASEMGGQGNQISSVSFFNTGTARTRNLDIYVVHTDKTVFESNSDWITVAESDKVFSGNVDFTAGEWTTIYFSKVFVYDGTSNVALIVDDNTNTYASNLSCRTFNTEGNQAIRVSTYGTNYDPCNPTTFTGTPISQKNQVIFGYPSYIYTVTASANPTNGGTVSGGGSGYFLGQSCTLTATETNPNYRFYNWTLDGEVVSNDAVYTFPVTGNMNLVANFGEPISVTVSANPEEGGTVSGGGGYGLNQPCTLTAVASPGYVFTKWTKGTSTSGLSYLSTYTVTVTEAANYVANFKQVDNSIVIGDAVSTNSYLPTYTYSQYSMSQQIYTVAEMGGTAREISSVSFFNTSYSRTRNLTVYMVHTTKTNFANDSDWITASENDVVFSGNVSITSQDWVTIYFETPFSYNGISNVALIIDDNTGSTNSTTNCRTFGTTDNQAIRVYGSNTNYDPSDLTGITGTLHSEKNQVVFGIVSYDYYVTTSASPAQGGTVSEGGGPYYLGQPCTVTATPNTGAGYCFYYWMKSNGTILSYEPTYTFPVMGNTSLTAVFGSPYHITATVGTEGGGTVTGGGDYGKYHTCTLIATPDPGYVFNYWTKNGSVESYYSTYSFTVYNSAEYVAVFELVSPNIAIGDAESNASFPSSSSYYTLSQQIYTADEIGMPGEISSISFFSTRNSDVTRNYSIYMKHTNKTSFGSSYDWVSISETDQVFSGNVTMTSGGWTEITFDTPFQYDGTSNIVLVVNDATGTYGNTSCRVFNTGSYQTTYAASSTSLDPSNASNYYGNRSTSKNQIILGFTPLIVEQTCTLVAGWNWWSSNVEITLDDLQTALVAAYPNAGVNSLIIKSNGNGQTAWNPVAQRWIGGLNTLDLTQMYMIKVATAGEITLQGVPINPAEYPVTIANGNNWIAFPLGQNMTVTNAFAGFPVNGDVIKSNAGGQATWNSTANRWIGGLTTLEPGKGYIYNSKASGNKEFIFPIRAK